MPKDKKIQKRKETDMAGYDHSQYSGNAGRNQASGYRSIPEHQRSGTYRDRDHDGGWSDQVAMDRFENRSGGQAYDRMSRGTYDQSYGRGSALEDGSPFSRGAAPGYGPNYGPDYGGEHRRRYNSSPSNPQDADRGMMARAGDEVLSWFGDEEAARRREEDHRGKGPKGYKRSDQRVLEDVNDRLSDDGSIDASDISVTIQDGEVTLTGTVQSKFAKRRAEDCTDAVSGVQHVQNNLRVAIAGPNVTQA